MMPKMTMSKTNLYTHVTALLTLLLLSLAACEKLEVPQKENNPENGPTEDDIIYTVDDILQQTYTQGKTTNIYLEGYIVGYIPGSNISQAIFDKGDIESNILLATTPSEEDPSYCIPVQLTTASNECRSTRDALNLADNPSMLHQHVRLKGDIASYMGVKGILKAHQHTLLPNEEEEEPKIPEDSENPEGPDSPDTPDTPDTPETPGTPEIPDIPDTPTIPETPTLQDTLDYVYSHGSSEETAYTVSDLRDKIPVLFEVTGANGIPSSYVCGYIIGYIPKNYSNISRTVFAAGDTQTNIVIADSSSETDYHRCIAIQLSTSTSGQREVKQGLNLSDHPENIGSFIVVRGNVTPYMGTIGVKSVSEAVLEP